MPMIVRTRPAPWVAVLLSATLLFLTACGAEDSDSSPGGATVEPTTAGTELQIAYDDGAGTTDTWTLTCATGGTPGGSHPDPTAACAALTAKGVKALQPRPADEMCTMIYGGPQTAKITGTVEGNSVETTIDRKDGCGISRWETLAGLLPEVTGATPPAG